MKTYQDLMKVGESDHGEFCKYAISEFKASRDYADAAAGEAYYSKHNLTIEKYQKMLYTLSGRQVPDIFSANYKLKTLFFRRLISQQVNYVLGNGMTLQEEGNKEKLGKDFDFQLMNAAKRAMVNGTAFGFWNFDHLEVFGFADTPKHAGFCPLYDENTAQLRAGIRFWSRRVGDDMMIRYTLYEEDGVTEYRQREDDPVVVIVPKRAYKTVVKQSAVGGIEETLNENYSRLPIVPLYASDTRESELNGIRESIDCYDFIKSGLANAIDDNAGFYWILKNTGGMDDVDLAKFVHRINTVKATVIDGDAGADAEAHTLEVPHEARSAMLELLRKDIYEDFQSLDVNTLSAASKTTQEIQAAYQAQDNKCADFEYYVTDFVQKILTLAEIDDNPTFTWNKIVNAYEQTQMVMMCSNILPQDTLIKHLPFLTPEEADSAIASNNDEGYNTFNQTEEETSEEEEDVNE